MIFEYKIASMLSYLQLGFLLTSDYDCYRAKSRKQSETIHKSKDYSNK